MKRILVIAILMIASVNVMNAQMTFGAKAGLNLANISGFPSGSGSMDVGFHVGGIAQYSINDNFSIAPEVLYSTAGSKFSYSESDGVFTSSATDNISLSYLQIPILAKYSLAKDEGLYFTAGIYFGLLLGNSDKTSTSISGGGFSSSSDTTVTGTSGMNTVDIGLALGAGYQLPGGLGFSVRYDIGLADVFKSTTETTTTYVYGMPITSTTTQPAYGKNGVIQISVSYMFGIGK